MAKAGAIGPPPGMVPDLQNPKDVLRTCNFITQALTITVVTVFLGTRLYAKMCILGRNFGLDDYAAYFAWLPIVGYCIASCFMSINGGGLNQWEVSPDKIPQFMQASYAAMLFYSPMAFTVRLALLALIIRIFGAIHRNTVIGIYLFIGMIGIYYVLLFFIKMFICWPISAFWLGPKDRCRNIGQLITADAIVSALSDLFILLLPIPLAWSLQHPKRTRIRIVGLLCAGGSATAFGIYRLVLFLKDGQSENQTIILVKSVMSSNAEAGIGMICACLPAVNAICIRRRRMPALSFNQGRKSSAGVELDSWVDPHGQQAHELAA